MATAAIAPAAPSHVLPGLTAGASLWRPKLLPAKYAATSAIHTIAAIASSSHGLASRSTTKANHVGHTTIQPAIAQIQGPGRAWRASHMGAAAIQKMVATTKAARATAMNPPSGSRTYASNSPPAI